MYQSITVIGHLGQDPEIRMTPTGQPVANVSVAATEKWTGKDGKKEERTEWFRVVCWGKLAEIVSKYCHKGDLVMFVGRMQTRSWEDNGVKRYATDLVASEMKMLSGKRESSGAGDTACQNYYGSSPYDTPRGGAGEDVTF
jgi:single-strand DNA-binding protein